MPLICLIKGSRFEMEYDPTPSKAYIMETLISSIFHFQIRREDKCEQMPIFYEVRRENRLRVPCDFEQQKHSTLIIEVNRKDEVAKKLALATKRNKIEFLNKTTSDIQFKLL